MRAGITIIALASFMVGCASKQPSATDLRHEADLQYAGDKTTALSFDPPIAQGNPRLNFNRGVREPSAFVGFDQTITTFFYVRSDDRQSNDRYNNRYERRAVSESFGTSYR